MRKIVFLLLALPFLISTACEQEIEFNRGIKDATGLEAFTNLTALDVWWTDLTRLDLEHNVQLKMLDCIHNSRLVSLDISKNAALEWLFL